MFACSSTRTCLAAFSPSVALRRLGPGRLAQPAAEDRGGLSGRVLARPHGAPAGRAAVAGAGPAGGRGEPAGAGGNIAADAVARATDDHTIGLMINGNMTIAKILNPATTYDPLKDLPRCR
jgi:hypothetical protein